MWNLGAGKTLLLAGAVLLGLGYTPANLYMPLAGLLTRSTGYLWQTCSGVAAVPRDPIRASILNVTSDFDEVSAEVQGPGQAGGGRGGDVRRRAHPLYRLAGTLALSSTFCLAQLHCLC